LGAQTPLGRSIVQVYLFIGLPPNITKAKRKSPGQFGPLVVDFSQNLFRYGPYSVPHPFDLYPPYISTSFARKEDPPAGTRIPFSWPSGKVCPF